MGIRVVVVDDNPHVSWEGDVYPVNATFHRFLSAVLDVPGVASIVHAVPLRPATVAPRTLSLDPRLEVVATAPFEGVAGFLRRAVPITRHNLRPLRASIRGADLVWVKVPASNALLTAWLARRASVPLFVYVAGNAGDVVAGQLRGPLAGGAARLVAAAYDAIGRLVGVGADRVVVGREVLTSLVEPWEVREPPVGWPHEPGRLRLAWAGRLAAGKGVETLLSAVARLDEVTLELLGDGPERSRLEARTRALGLDDRVTFDGYIADRESYLKRLAAADLFVFPSPAEGFPKAVLDAMAAGLPIVATPAGGLNALARDGLLEPVSPGDPVGLEAAIRRLADQPERAIDLARRGSEFAGDHTRPVEAARVVGRWRARWPQAFVG